MPDCSWLFKYGRVPLSLLITDNLWQVCTLHTLIAVMKRLIFVFQRIDAPISHKALRSKLSVIAQAVSDSNLAVHPHALQPYDDHWHPASSLKKTRSASTQLAACNIVPREDRVSGISLYRFPILTFVQPIAPGMLEKWDYILRRLFVVKAKPFVKAITFVGIACPISLSSDLASHLFNRSLCPGADALLEPLTSRAIPVEDRLDVSKPIRELSTEDWLKVVKAFDEWPFAPTVSAFSHGMVIKFDLLSLGVDDNRCILSRHRERLAVYIPWFGYKLIASRLSILLTAPRAWSRSSDTG